MTPRTDVYLTAAFAVLILVIGLTTLITGVLTTSEVGPVIATGTTLTTAGALATLVTGYRAARHYITYKTDRAAVAALANAIVTHDAAVTKQEPPDAKVLHLGGSHTRRLT
ncbi:hypothetical protein [Streptomyces shenzhenensis]|uniref:Uncharacterized protein n=1 Tax=Streptomyces shenzhenensis TaxID=943815 RepID=A0A3M0I226_9ACTN|nr:hypothetical protein [Streptomyces shenzhenensis]RMB83681.1 hypothetical protein CTZ28_23485 [Streptomyces shenzhenensis]